MGSPISPKKVGKDTTIHYGLTSDFVINASPPALRDIGIYVYLILYSNKRAEVCILTPSIEVEGRHAIHLSRLEGGG